MSIRRGFFVALFGLVLASCSSGGSTSTTTPPTTRATSGGPVSPSASGAATTVPVTESEFAITLSSKTFTAGSYTFKVTNNGKFPHNFTLDGPGLSDKATKTLNAGSSDELTVALQKGSYQAYCSVDSHKDKGMDLTLQVS